MADDSARPDIHLNLFAFGCGHHAAAWRAPDSAVEQLGEISYWEDLARTAERGKLDAFFLADGQAAGIGGVGRGPLWFLEPITTLSAIARATERIGLVTTVSSTFWDPFHTARLLASLDHISHGRAGINVVTSMTDDEARNHGMAELPDAELRYERAEEFVTVIGKLWSSWPREALVRDADGRYVDESRLRRIDHHGTYFEVAGPLNTPECPQGRPVLFQAGASEPGRDLAARYAEGIYAVAWNLDQAVAYRSDIRARAAGYGRNPDELQIMPGLVAYVASTEREARERQRELNALLPTEDSLRQLSFFVGSDVSDWDLDGPVPDLPPLETFRGPKGRYATVLTMIAEARPTVRELLGLLAAGGGHCTIAGTPERIADMIETWVDRGGADGFNLMPPSLPGGIEDFVDHVVPELQRRGRFRRDYGGSTLRSHLAR